jgi:threonine dehydrogenase-like Zn-dependent dehydrogenase
MRRLINHLYCRNVGNVISPVGESCLAAITATRTLLRDAAKLVRRGGQLTVVGTFPESNVTKPIAYLKDREIDMNFSRGNFQAFAPCLGARRQRTRKSGHLSHRFPLDRAKEAFELLAARDVEAHTITLHPTDS